MISAERPPRIAFVSLSDANDPADSSGAPYNIRKGFQDIGCSVIDVFPLSSHIERLFLCRKLLHRVRGYYYSPNREPDYLQEIAALIEDRLADIDYDFLFAVHSVPVTKVKIRRPIVISHDQTFLERMDYFPFEKRPPARDYVDKALVQEYEAFHNADLCVYPSERSAEILKSHFLVPQENVSVIPWGANLPREPTHAQASDYIGSRDHNRLQITFIGVEWARKGGDIVVQTCSILRERGIDVRLNIIGAQPPASDSAYMQVFSFLDKKSSRDFEQYWDLISQSHFLFVPSRVEAYGHVFCEAAAFGVPSVAANTGGIPTIIENGITGYCLDLDASPMEFADKIQALFQDKQAYSEMAHRCRERYETRLNWRSFCRSVVDALSTRSTLRSSYQGDLIYPVRTFI